MDYGFLIVFFISFVANIIFVVYIKAQQNHKKKEEMVKRQDVETPTVHPVSKPNLTYEEVTSIVRGLVNDKFIKRKVLVYDLNNMRLYDIQKEMSIIASDVMGCIGEPFKSEFYYYYSQNYLMEYVINIVELLLLDDLKKRRIA